MTVTAFVNGSAWQYRARHRLAAKITDLATSNGWPWKVEVVFNPDAAIIASHAVAMTSDS